MSGESRDLVTVGRLVMGGDGMVGGGWALKEPVLSSGTQS